jgi:hypothetical protein
MQPLLLDQDLASNRWVMVQQYDSAIASLMTSHSTMKLESFPQPFAPYEHLAMSAQLI